MPSANDIQKVVGAGSIAFGAIAALTPRLFLSMYGVTDEASVRTMTRIWGTRTAVLGALTFGLEGTENNKKLMTLTTAMNAADAVMVAAAGGVPVRARVLGSLTSATFAGATAYALNQLPELAGE